MRTLLLAAVVLLSGAAPASAATFTVPGVPAAGPSKYDRVLVERFGPADARRVLVLSPGFQGGAGDFALIGPELVRRVPGLQVWAVDRRTQAFEDPSGFASGDPQRAFDYYLGGGGFKPVAGADVPYVREWGLPTAMGDLNRVVRRARAGGRREVILGGHSLGASLTVAYASWDFRGRPGHRDLDGMVLIDGGLLGTFTTPGPAGVRRRLAEVVRRPVRGPARHRRPVGGGRVHRDRRAGRAARSAGPLDARRVPGAPSLRQAAVPGDQRGADRPGVRP